MMTLKTSEELQVMTEGGRRLARILAALTKEVRVGVSTKVLDAKARELAEREGGTPAFLGYKPDGAKQAFPAALCVSVNDTIVHGIPSDYTIRDGDLVSLDMGLLLEGFYTDSAVTVGVGSVSREKRKLLAVTERALHGGIEAAAAGNTLGDVGHAISSAVRGSGFSVIRSLIGHGIGRALHEEPAVQNFGNPHEGEELKVGMVLAIEPMVAMGNGEITTLPDESFATADGTLSAHFEHTVAITKEGPRILTIPV